MEKAHDYKQPAPIVLMHSPPLTLVTDVKSVSNMRREGQNQPGRRLQYSLLGILQLVLLKKTSLTTVHVTQVIIK